MIVRSMVAWGVSMDEDRWAIGSFIAANLRPVDHWDDTTSPPTPVFVPPLSSAEQATLADLAKMARFGLVNSLSLAEFRAIKGNLADLRPGSALENALTAERTRTDAQWNALTTAQTKTATIAYLRDLTDAVADLRAVLAALLRDS